MTDHRVAVLGCGAWGQNLVRNFYQLGVLAAVADPSESGQQTAQKLAPGVPIVADPLAAIAALLQNSKTRAVSPRKVWLVIVQACRRCQTAPERSWHQLP